MSSAQTGPKNGQWRGGRTVASNGYVLVRVGKGHHLADTRGYAYEHRLVAEHKIGRRLLPGELVHHIDHDKRNNNPTNLQVIADQAHHRLEHRHVDRDDALRMPGEPNRTIACACGCRTEFPMFDASGRRRRFVSGHNARRAA